jgi:hypothetical protein
LYICKNLMLRSAFVLTLVSASGVFASVEPQERLYPNLDDNGYQQAPQGGEPHGGGDF